ncbi:DNA gyrase inhibitor YacG [Bradyrhizobium sp. Cp5.3]|uniref:DNA gyrase inhibitor YacG n=1 Tax=Bradyrhizobium sp. Cp5.3 TaxID=443598 RepID=UPI0004075641|nr:DNA gyrase inhibitor YacG [Bradyrhizobium sp. Cp5.3]
MDDHVKKPANPKRKCPICGKPAEHATRPFCSSRCRDVDLNRWLKGSYVIPGRDDGTDDVE